MPDYRLLTPSGNVPLAGKELLIGSSPDCPVRAEGPEVASHHARIVIRSKKPPVVEPVSPGCEVFLDGKPVARRAELAPGSVLRVGTTEISLELATGGELAPVKKKRPLWRRLLRLALYTAASFVLLVVLVAVLVPFILSEARVKQTIKENLEEQLRRDVTIGGVKLEIFKGLKITDLTVANKEGFSPDRQFLTVKEVDVRVDVWRLLSSGLADLECSVTLEEPAVFLEREETRGATNIDDLLKSDGDKEKGAKKKGGKKKDEDDSSGPLGSIERVNLKLTVRNGALEFDDRFNKASSRIQDLNLKASVDNFDVPALAGKLSYELSMASPAGGGPGKVDLAGGADFAVDPGRKNLLGFGFKRLSGEMVGASVENLDPSALAKHLGLPEPGKDVSLQIKLTAASPDRITLTGTLEVPQLDVVSLGIHEKPVPGLGAKVTLNGSADLAKGDADLALAVKTPLCEKAGGSVAIRGLPAVALASGQLAGAAAAGRIKLDFGVKADVGKLTGGEVGRIFKAEDRVEGTLELAVKAEGTAGDLPVKITAALRKLLVPPSYTDGKQLPEEDITLTMDGRLSLDPGSLGLKKSTFSAVIESAAVKGRLTGGEFVPAGDGKNAQAKGKLALRAKFKQLADRYAKVMPGLPALNEDLTLTASANSEGDLIALSAEMETRRAAGKPDPLEVKLTTHLRGTENPGGAKNWDLPDLKLTARTPQSPSLNATVTGQVRGLTAEKPEFDVKLDLRADMAALWDRVAPVLELYPDMKKLAAMGFAGTVRIKDGRVHGTPQKFSSALLVDVTGLKVTGPGLPEKGVGDANVQLVANLDLEPEARRLEARAVRLTSSFCNLTLSGEVSDYGRMLGTYELSLNVPDARKTTALLAGFGWFPEDLKLKGTAVVALSANTALGTARIEQCIVDTNLAKAKISGNLKGFQLVEVPAGDGKGKGLELKLKDPSGSLVLEECSADVSVIGKLRKVFGGIPEDLEGAGPVRLSGRLVSTPDKEFGVKLAFDATDAKIAFSGLVDKPARTPASVELAGSWNPNVGKKSLKMSSLAVRLGELRLSGSGTADVRLAEKLVAASGPGGVAEPERTIDVGQVVVRLSVPEFEIEEVRKLLPALEKFRLGGKLELTKISASGDLKQFLESKRPLLSGRLAGLSYEGKAELRDVHFEYDELPNMRLRCSGAVAVSTRAVDIEDLSVGVVHKRSKHESRFVVKKGRVTSARKGAKLLADLQQLAADVELSSPEVKVEEILAALETPETGKKPAAGKTKPKPGKAPAAPEKPKGGKKEESPYEFLKGYRMTGRLQAGRVSYEEYALTDLAGKLALEENVFRVAEFEAKAYGGGAKGNVTADLNHPKIAHSGGMNVKDVDVNRVASEAQGWKDICGGKVSGDIAWRGTGIEPAKMIAWKGSSTVAAEGLAVRNIDKVPPFQGRTKDLAALLVPDLVKKLSAAEYEFTPGKMTVSMEDGVVKGKGFEVKTLGEDPLTIAFAASLKVAEKGMPFGRGSGLYLKRLPDKWLVQIDYDNILRHKVFSKIPRDKLRKYVPESMVREAVRKAAAKGDIYYPLSRNDRTGLARFLPLKGLGDIFKNIAKQALEKYIKDKLLGRLVKEPKPKPEPKPEPKPRPGPGPKPEPKPEPKPGPKPEPVPGAGRIVVQKWSVGGNIFKPKIKIETQVHGAKAANLTLYAVLRGGVVAKLKNRSCKDGEAVSIESSYTRGVTQALELKLFDAGGKVLATERRAAR